MQEENNSYECKPLKSLSELLSWRVNKSDWSVLVKKLASRSNYCYAASDLKCHQKVRKPRKLLNSSVPKTLVCHDMKGGYLDDKYVHGSVYNHQYLFYHWSAIDVFVYFSHHFVTIPPLMWINAAHNHGVQILGTLITEHTEGKQIWNDILQDENLHNQVTDQLAIIQQHYGFDGYLVNIENEIDLNLLPKLADFLRDLRSKMKKGSVIWYDAVSFVNGKLKWQNELNEHNKPAFEICDGVFLNYAWKEQNLETSLKNSGIRQHNVYVGVDVFGRGCYGGGGFNTDIALSVIRSFNLSTAIFGFGWTHETQANDFQFFAIENKFWTKLFPYLFIHCPNSTPLKTNFNQGIEINSEKGTLWYNLSSQSFILTLPSCLNTCQDKEASCFDFCRDDSFIGGSCLLLNVLENETEIHELLMCNLLCAPASPLKFSISAKCVENYEPFLIFLAIEQEERDFSIQLNFSDKQISSFTDNDYSCLLALSNQLNSTKTIQTTEHEWITNTFYLDFNGVITKMWVKIRKPTMIGNISFE